MLLSNSQHKKTKAGHPGSLHQSPALCQKRRSTLDLRSEQHYEHNSHLGDTQKASQTSLSGLPSFAKLRFEINTIPPRQSA